MGPLATLTAAVLLVASMSPSSAADMCGTGVAGIVTSCEAAGALAAGLARTRVDRTLATDPLTDRGRRLDGTAASPTGVLPPFAMSADGDNTSFQTSLSQWGSALSAADIAAMKQAQDAIGAEVALPQTPRPKPKFDMWVQGRSTRLVDGGFSQGNALTSYVGADYRWHHDLLIGGMVQLDDSRRSILFSPDVVQGEAFMAGPYMAYRLTPNLLLDAKAAWGMGHDSAISGAESLSLDTNRMLTEARLTGNWGWNAWQLSQSGAVTYIAETNGVARLPDTLVDLTRLTLGPEVKRRFDVGNDASIEPFAFFRSSLDLAAAGWQAPLGQNTVGGGVTLAKPDTYNIKAMADFTESTGGQDEVATGKVLVTVPSRLFGF